MRTKSQNQESGKAILEIVRQATASLATMDAVRLEELVQGCADLNWEPSNIWEAGPAPDSNRMDGLAFDLRVLRQVLVETRSNLSLLERMHAARLASTSRSKGISRIADVGGSIGGRGMSWEQ